MFKNCVVLILASFPVVSFADYYVTGEVIGTECSGIVIKVCESKVINAVEKNGALFEITKKFSNVDNYSNGKCTIKTKNNNGGMLALATNAITQPKFLTLKNGSYESIDAEYISFKCYKR